MSGELYSKNEEDGPRFDYVKRPFNHFSVNKMTIENQLRLGSFAEQNDKQPEFTVDSIDI